MSFTQTRKLLSLQLRVLLALILRETRATFGTSSFGYIWAIITPTASVGLLVFIFSLVGRQPPFGSSLALFFATGILTLNFFKELSGKLMSVFNANRALLTYPVIKDIDTLLARSILIIITYLLIMFIFFTSLVALNLAHLPTHIEQLLFAFFSTALLGLGMGTMNAVITSIWDTWTQIEKVLTRPLFFISGIFYVPSLLPIEAISVLKWNPVLHLIEWFREGFYPNYNSFVLNRSYPIYLGIFLLLVGLAGERFLRKLRF
jgi:capsular polysaccharide transport system permease protein